MKMWRTAFVTLIVCCPAIWACDESRPTNTPPKNQGNDPSGSYWTPPASAASTSSPLPGSSGDTTPNPNPNPNPTPAGQPTIGAHGLAFHRYRSDSAPLLSPKMKTAPSGSTVIVSVARGEKNNFATGVTTDNKNPGVSYSLIGPMHTYAKWPNSGTAVFALKGAKGGDDHFLTTTTPPEDEITAAAVEVKGGSTITDIQWNEPLVGTPTTSRSVTTTGPAALIAFWWGDGGTHSHSATPNNGFTVLDSIGEPGSLIQCFVAAKTVPAAGTYDITWTSNPAEGAQLWLVAVQ